MTAASLPQFDDLPALGDFPRGCAWGLFDKNGVKDRIGTLNLLDGPTVKAAASEIQVGQSVSLNWPLDSLHKPHARRIPVQHKHIDLNFLGITAFDDELHFNTQGSSQWDSFCHYAHQGTGCFYNGAKPDLEGLKQKDLPTLDAWHQRGGLVGRGVLLDYVAWAEATSKSHSPLKSYGITTAELEAVAAHQGTEFRHGDILLVRVGLTEALAPLSEEQQTEALGPRQLCGLAGDEDMARWIWNHHFAAVAADNLACEQQPPKVGKALGKSRCFAVV